MRPRRWTPGGGSTHPRHLLIVVNMSLSTISKTITLCGITPTTVTSVYGESRWIGSAGVPTFTDTFGPGARHIYLIR